VRETAREWKKDRKRKMKESGRGREEGTRRCYIDEESSYSRFKCIDDVLMAHQVEVMRVALTRLLRSPL